MMGGTASQDVWVWVDFEGGMNSSQPLWDAAFCFDFPGKPLECLRVVHMTKPRHQKAVRSSLPKHMRHAFEMNKTYVMKYDNKFELDWFACQHDKNMRDVVRKHLPPPGSTVLAWNMMGHDKKVLENLDAPEYVLLDPLREFRKRIGLPKNTLSTKKPGTPRHALSVPILGPPHTAIADALHMREVTRRAALVLAKPGNLNFDLNFNIATEDEVVDALKSFLIPRKPPPGLPKPQPKWLWSSLYWDADNRLKQEHSKAYKQRVRKWAKLEGTSLNAVKKQETLRRLLEKQNESF